MEQPDRYTAALSRLGDQLATARKFATIFEAFERTFSADRDFFAACERAQSPLLDAVLDELARQRRARWTWVTPLSRHAPARFLHGAGTLGGGIAIVLYFEERHLGLVTVCGATTDFLRFSTLALPSGAYVQRPSGGAS